MDLDAKGAGSPEGLVARILKAEPGLSAPIPIEQLCRALDITDIQDLDSEGFEGGLITDTERSAGIILARKGYPYRCRFTIAHELAHFLIPTHMPDIPGRFLCSRADMARLSASESDRRGRMEVQANRFASLLLIPPPLLRSRLVDLKDPNISQMVQLAEDFEVSKQAMARAYAQYHQELIAFVFIKAGKVLFTYKHSKFPFIVVRQGTPIPERSLFRRKPVRRGDASEIAECIPDVWIDVERGRPAPGLFEQVLGQRDDYAILMLWLERAEEEEESDEEAEMTSKERLRSRIGRYGAQRTY